MPPKPSYAKSAITLVQQIAQLKRRGLIISDDKIAEHYLKNISYYRLAGYWWPLQSDKVNHIFKSNSRFETVIALYNFDRELRIILFDEIELIEIGLRTKLIYELSHSHSPFWFEDASLFIDISQFNKNLIKIDEELQHSKEIFIKEHYRKYNTAPRPPAWKTLEVLSLGHLSKLYGNLKPTIAAKDGIARNLGVVNHTYFHSWIQGITQIRNICAHHGRIWNRHLPSQFKLMTNPPRPWLNTKPVEWSRLPSPSTNTLYTVLCCMKYLLNTINPSNTLTAKLTQLFAAYPNVDLRAMGFTAGWNNEPLWV
jgi:abortive infection bacteriophage resistance protein